jgi:type IV pilus assembly protein PilC
MKFLFKAKTKSGEIKEGVIDVMSKEAAVSILQKNELYPISIVKEEANPSIIKTILKYYDQVTPKELMVFFRQLSILVEARVPIVASLSAISEQTANKYFIKVIKEVVADIENGMPLSDALAKHKDIFSLMSINIIKAGETSGNLKKSIDYVADNIERNYNLAGRVRSALIYPCIIIVVFFIIGFLVISFILPKLTTIIKELNADVPWYTQVVMSIGDFMAVYWWAVAVVIFGFVGGILYYVRTEAGIKEWDQIKIKLPIVGVIFRNVYITRFAQNLSVLLSGGIPIIRALTITSSVLNNVVYEAIVKRAADEVKVGGNISTVFAKSALIPPVVSHMIKIGEDSGQIDTVLNHIAKFYDQETEMMTKNLSVLIEPILMIIIGIGVGFMAFAILMPIYNIAGQIK